MPEASVEAGISLELDDLKFIQFNTYDMECTPYNKKLPAGEPITFAANAETGSLTYEEPGDGFKNGIKIPLQWTAPAAANDGNLVIETTWSNLESSQLQVRLRSVSF